MVTSQKNLIWIFLRYTGLAAILVLAGCDSTPLQSPVEENDQLESIDLTDPRILLAMELQDSLSQELLSHQGLVGTGITLSDDGDPSIVVFSVSEPATWPASKKNVVPTSARDIPVEVIVTGEIVANRPIPNGESAGKKKKPGGGNGAMRFDRPVPIGVSTGDLNVSAGTIGARVTDGSNVYALSNNHVYADRNRASIGDAIIQPGIADGGTSPADDIGTLYDFIPIDFSGSCTNTVDAAIAITSTLVLDKETPSDGYGAPLKSELAPSANMKVMKYGRTTGLTSGKISAINVTIEVSYGSDGIACFTDQLVIIPGDFSSGGDSGSLIVASKKKVKNRPVGLLFAGSRSVTVANQIGSVFSELGVSIDIN